MVSGQPVADAERIITNATAQTQRNWFGLMAQKTSKAVGSSAAFVAICVVTLVWLVTGPMFHWSDTWQLVINTVTNLVSMLMVFLIQNTQNRESVAQQLKLDELLRAVRGAQNTFINIEHLTEQELEPIKELYAALAEKARRNADAGSASVPTSSE
jgi:low affinity Fe/Cu permease